MCRYPEGSGAIISSSARSPSCTKIQLPKADSPNLTTTLPGTALGRTTSTDSVLLAFLPRSISLLALVNFSKADFGTGRVST